MRLLWLLIFVALIPHAAAYDESEAPSVASYVDAVWHEPAAVQPGEQWNGFIRFVDGHNVSEVRYWICNVGLACFAPPHLASQIDANTWMFDTDDYRSNDQKIQWGIEDGRPWRVGVQYNITFQDGHKEWLPEGLAIPSPECEAAGWQACSETHYFAFDMPGAKPRVEGAPLPLVAVMAGLLIALLRRRA